MVITYKTINKVKFPVYLIPSANWDLADGMLFLDGLILDDKNMEGSTLGARRIQTSWELFPLKKSVFDFIGVVKQTTPYFIDSNGIPFIYQKTKFLTLKYIKIKKITLKTKASVLHLQNEKTPFKIYRPPMPGMCWAGILYYHGLPWKLYEYSEEKNKDTRRKI